MLKILNINCKEFTFIQEQYSRSEINPVEIFLATKLNYELNNIEIALKFVFVNSNNHKYLVLEIVWLVEYDNEFWVKNGVEDNNIKKILFPKSEIIELLTSFYHNVVGFIVAKSNEYSTEMPLIQVDFKTIITQDLEIT